MNLSDLFLTTSSLICCYLPLLQADPAKAVSDAEKLKRERMEEEEEDRNQTLLMQQVSQASSSVTVLQIVLLIFAPLSCRLNLLTA